MANIMTENHHTNNTLNDNNQQFVKWFRSAAPYIHANKGHIFIVCFGGDMVQNPDFSCIVHDIALLSSLGIRLVLVYGIRPQVEQGLRMYGQQSRYVNGTRITDKVALNCVKAACGEVFTEIESLLSMGLTNSPTNNVNIRTTSGNFITACPIGIHDGVDYCYTGEVRRVDETTITRRLDEGYIVLISPIGYSPTGESFNLLAEEVAARVAIALHATKLIYLTNTEGLLDNNGDLVRELTTLEAQHRLEQQPTSNFENCQQLTNAINACNNGVQRVHLISHQTNGSLLLELFTRDGIGTLISTDPFEHLRKATIDDVGGLFELIEPLEKAGILVRRSREKLEMEIDNFIVQERDGTIIGCAALYPFTDECLAELACLAVHSDYRRTGRGDALLAFLEREAQQLKLTRIFVFTTRAAHWFQERGFIAAKLNSLPISQQTLYNYQRNSKVFVKWL